MLRLCDVGVGVFRNKNDLVDLKFQLLQNKDQIALSIQDYDIKFFKSGAQAYCTFQLILSVLLIFQIIIMLF